MKATVPGAGLLISQYADGRVRITRPGVRTVTLSALEVAAVKALKPLAHRQSTKICELDPCPPFSISGSDTHAWQ